MLKNRKSFIVHNLENCSWFHKNIDELTTSLNTDLLCKLRINIYIYPDKYTFLLSMCNPLKIKANFLIKDLL